MLTLTHGTSAGGIVARARSLEKVRNCINQFVVGKSYGWVESGLDPLTVLSRTEKTIKVTNGQNTWRMHIRHDERGEYVVDSSVPKGFRLMYTCRAIWEDKTWKPNITH